MSDRRLTQQEVEAILPHRGNALFMRFAQIAGFEGVGAARWPADYPMLEGHFPGLPIVPGVLLIEAAAQLAGLVIASNLTPPGEARVLGMLSGVRRCLIHLPVFPEETIEYRLSVARQGQQFFQATGVGQRDARKVVSFELTLAFAERSSIS